MVSSSPEPFSSCTQEEKGSGDEEVLPLLNAPPSHWMCGFEIKVGPVLFDPCRCIMHSFCKLTILHRRRVLHQHGQLRCVVKGPGCRLILPRVPWVKLLALEPCGPTSKVVVPAEPCRATGYEIVESRSIPRDHTLRKLQLSLS